MSLESKLFYATHWLLGRYGRRIFSEDSLITMHRLVDAPASTHRWPVHTCLWAARQVLASGADFIECGVNEGVRMLAILQALPVHQPVWLVDTYCGLDRRYATGGELRRFLGAYPECYQATRQRFSTWPNVCLIRGPVPDVLPQVDAARVGWLHIDMNCAIPERAALEYFWPRLIPGGIIMLDDYGHAGFENQTRTHREFAWHVGSPILCLPTGQGMMIKQRA